MTVTYSVAIFMFAVHPVSLLFCVETEVLFAEQLPIPTTQSLGDLTSQSASSVFFSPVPTAFSTGLDPESAATSHEVGELSFFPFLPSRPLPKFLCPV